MSGSIGGVGAADGDFPASEAGEAATELDPAANVSRSPTGPARPSPAGAPPADVAEVEGIGQAAPGSPAAVATAFYDAFARRDYDAMEPLYDPNVRFEDPIFNYSDRDGTMGMWRALLSKADGIRVTSRLEGVDGDVAKVHWTADYNFNGRPVHNEVDSALTIRDGKIVDQHDSFDWSKWAKQALPFGDVSDSQAVRWAVTGILRLVAMTPPM